MAMFFIQGIGEVQASVSFQKAWYADHHVHMMLGHLAGLACHWQPIQYSQAATLPTAVRPCPRAGHVCRQGRLGTDHPRDGNYYKRW